ncbi:MAG: serine/threonine protein kinase [Gemmataceae bacterium]|nr:serine/threonine protein kinase [Gemmataceae bacterium]
MDEESLFVAALDRPAGADRRAFLDEACGGDARLRERVERLLASDDQTRGILDAGPNTPLPAVDRLRPPLASGREVAGRYWLVRRLGEGGMGEVWEADQTAPVRRPVALKVIRPGFDAAALLARFDQERQAIALMDHPHIAKVFDAGVAEGLPYLVLELVDGPPVTAYCDARELTVRRRLELFVAVCRAVQHAHQKGVIHRDLKPSNVLVAEADGRPVPKVIDFGIAKAAGAKLTEETVRTGHGAILGTPEYMAPEQAAGDGDVDTRADVYALGVMLYELLTGTTPFARPGAGVVGVLDLLRAIREDEPPPPSRRLSELRNAGCGAADPDRPTRTRLPAPPTPGSWTGW